MSKLFVVATPIGNLEDITLRAIATLKSVDYILCEDTRVSQKLLTRFSIQKPLISYHQHSELSKVDYILKLLQDGKNLALISDAGTPGISDPGGKLIEAVVKVSRGLPSGDSQRSALGVEIEVIPIPGPSALTAIASVAGFSMDKFLFLGFPPHKKGRNKFFEEIADSAYPVIFYESCHRILKTLGELKEVRFFPERKERTSFQVVVGRELTKKFETIYRGTIDEVAKKIENDKIKGEFVVIINKS